MEPEEGREEGREEEGPLFAWLPPEDRLWRHPSEVGEPRPSGAPRVRVARPRTWMVACVAGVIGAVLASGIGVAAGFFPRRTIVDPVPVPNTLVATSSDVAQQVAVGDWPAIANNLAPSLVTITNGGQTASGVIYAPSNMTNSSYVITAADAVNNNGRIEVTFENGTRSQATLVGLDPVSGIALLNVGGSGLAIPTFGSARDLAVADQVLVVGARTSDAPTVPATLSGIDEQMQTAGGYILDGMLAVDGVTVPASSDGGALVDAGGAVVGIDTDLVSAAADQQDMAFAVPIDTVEAVANELLAGRHPTHPWIGIEDATDVSTITASSLNIQGGAEIGAVQPGSPVALAGITAGDILTRFDGRPVTSSGMLVSLLAQSQPDARTSVTYLSAGDRPHKATLVVANLTSDWSG